MGDPTVPIPKKRRKPHVKGLKWREDFLKNLQVTGIVRMSCRLAGVSIDTAYEHRNTDAEFAARWDDAISQANEALVLRARERAMSESDTMLIFLLKSHMPEVYGDRIRMEHTGANGGPIKSEWTEQERLAAHSRLVARVGTGTGVAPADGQTPADGSLLDGAGVDHDPGEAAP